MTGKSFTWDPSIRRYITSKGKELTPQEVRAIIDDLVDKVVAKLQAFGELLRKGKMSGSDFQIRMAKQIIHLHRTASVLAAGGEGQMVAAQWEELEAILKAQLNYLHDFIVEVPDDIAERSKGIPNRSALYGRAAIATYENAVRLREVAAGESLERRLLGRSVESCDDCLEIEELNWVDIGTLPAIGEKIGGGPSACMVNCDCRFEFTHTRPGTPDPVNPLLNIPITRPPR